VQVLSSSNLVGEARPRSTRCVLRPNVRRHVGSTFHQAHNPLNVRMHVPFPARPVATEVERLYSVTAKRFGLARSVVTRALTLNHRSVRRRNPFRTRQYGSTKVTYPHGTY